MWARIESNNIVEYYDRKQSIVLNNVSYYSQIYTIWTEAQRKALVIVAVVVGIIFYLLIVLFLSFLPISIF